jgi:hypothetical protein
MTVIELLAWLLVALAIIDWFALWIVHRAYRRHRDVISLRDQGIRFGLTALGSTATAVIAFNYLFRLHLWPAAYGFAPLALALIFFSAPPGYFVYTYFWRYR